MSQSSQAAVLALGTAMTDLPQSISPVSESAIAAAYERFPDDGDAETKRAMGTARYGFLEGYRAAGLAPRPKEPFVISDEDWQRALDCAMSCLRPEWTKASDISRIEMDNAMQHAFGILSLAYEGRRGASPDTSTLGNSK